VTSIPGAVSAYRPGMKTAPAFEPGSDHYP